jgi:hypothetical protein
LRPAIAVGGIEHADIAIGQQTEGLLKQRPVIELRARRPERFEPCRVDKIRDQGAIDVITGGIRFARIAHFIGVQ